MKIENLIDRILKGIFTESTENPGELLKKREELFNKPFNSLSKDIIDEIAKIKKVNKNDFRKSMQKKFEDMDFNERLAYFYELSKKTILSVDDKKKSLKELANSVISDSTFSESYKSIKAFDLKEAENVPKNFNFAEELEKNPVVLGDKKEKTMILGRIVEYDNILLQRRSAEESIRPKGLSGHKIFIKIDSITPDKEIAVSDEDGEFIAKLEDKGLTNVKIYAKINGEEFYNTYKDKNGFSIEAKTHVAVNIVYLPTTGAIITGKIVEHKDQRLIRYSIADKDWQIKLLGTDIKSAVISLDTSLSPMLKKPGISKSFWNGKFVMVLSKDLKFPINDAIICAERDGQEFYMTDKNGKNPYTKPEPFEIKKGERYEGIEIPIDLSGININLKVKNGNAPEDGATVTLIDDSTKDKLDPTNAWGSAVTNKYGLCNFIVPKDSNIFDDISKKSITFKVVKNGETDSTSKKSDGVEVE